MKHSGQEGEKVDHKESVFLKAVRGEPWHGLRADGGRGSAGHPTENHKGAFGEAEGQDEIGD